MTAAHPKREISDTERDFMEAQQRANAAQHDADKAREKAGLPEWD